MHRMHYIMGMLAAAFSLHLFGDNQPLLKRECASGMSLPAYFLARVSVNCIDLCIYSFMLAAAHFLISQPEVPFWLFFLPVLFTTLNAAGWGFLISMVIPRRHGAFIAITAMYVLNGLFPPGALENVLTGGFGEVLVSCLIPSRWAIQMNFDTAFRIHSLTPTDGGLTDFDRTLLITDIRVLRLREFAGCGYWWTSAIVLLLLGVLMHCLAFALLRHRQWREKW